MPPLSAISLRKWRCRANNICLGLSYFVDPGAERVSTAKSSSSDPIFHCGAGFLHYNLPFPVESALICPDTFGDPGRYILYYSDVDFCPIKGVVNIVNNILASRSSQLAVCLPCIDYDKMGSNHTPGCVPNHISE